MCGQSELDDLLAFGRFCNLKPARAKQVIADVVQAVEQWPAIAERAGLARATIEKVQRSQRTALG